jgi:hypothetical protein
MPSHRTLATIAALAGSVFLAAACMGALKPFTVAGVVVIGCMVAAIVRSCTHTD